MKNQIWKYELTLNTELTIPEGAKVLTIQEQHGNPQIWFVVNPENEKVTRSFEIIGTGHSFDYDESKQYIGTFQLSGGALVFHVFEVIPVPGPRIEDFLKPAIKNKL